MVSFWIPVWLASVWLASLTTLAVLFAALLKKPRANQLSQGEAAWIIARGQLAAVFVVVVANSLGGYIYVEWFLAAGLIVAIAWAAFRRFSRHHPPGN